MSNKVKEEKSSFWWAVLGFFFPLISIIFLVVFLATDRNKDAKMIGIAAAIGFVCRLFIPIIIIIMLVAYVGHHPDTFEDAGSVIKCLSLGSEYHASNEDGIIKCINDATGEIKVFIDYDEYVDLDEYYRMKGNETIEEENN